MSKSISKLEVVIFAINEAKQTLEKDVELLDLVNSSEKSLLTLLLANSCLSVNDIIDRLKNRQKFKEKGEVYWK
jgi:hypothetical protein